MKKTRKEFSYRAFSAWAGFKAPNQLQLVILDKRNIALSSLNKYFTVLKLKKSEEHYFELLVKYRQSNDAKPDVAVAVRRTVAEATRCTAERGAARVEAAAHDTGIGAR